jgi:hypothetical protein
VVSVDDSVSACSRAGVDSEDFHVQRLGTRADDSSYLASIRIQRFTERAWPNASAAVTVAW